MKEEKVIVPSAALAFKEALNGARGELDAWLECHDEADVRAYIKHAIAEAEPPKEQQP